jgi:hypothetical protein
MPELGTVSVHASCSDELMVRPSPGSIGICFALYGKVVLVFAFYLSSGRRSICPHTRYPYFVLYADPGTLWLPIEVPACLGLKIEAEEHLSWKIIHNRAYLAREDLDRLVGWWCLDRCMWWLHSDVM